MLLSFSEDFSLVRISVTKREILLQNHNEICHHFADFDYFGRLHHHDSYLRDWP